MPPDLLLTNSSSLSLSYDPATMTGSLKSSSRVKKDSSISRPLSKIFHMNRGSSKKRGDSDGTAYIEAVRVAISYHYNYMYYKDSGFGGGAGLTLLISNFSEFGCST